MLKLSFLLRLKFFAWLVTFSRVPRYKDALLASPCWKRLHKPSYPHHPGGVSRKGEKSHVVP
jgi:hypothetical protein